ncbi:MAG: hypothetical protein JRH01_19910 [Deltaproteobacteria bacterium]|nr:hypothetical protein [Deltaproteobacteria bacterium]
MIRHVLLASILAIAASGIVAMAWPRSGDVAPRSAPVIEARKWLNSKPLTAEDLCGNVVLVE